MNSFVVREAKTGDVEAIVEVLTTCFSDKFNVIFDSKLREGKKALIEDLKNKNGLKGVFVATYDGKVVGVLSLTYKEIQRDRFFTLQVFIKHLGVYKGIKAIILGGFFPFVIRKDECCIDYLGVLPSYRRQGIGEKLHTYGEKAAIEDNKKHFFCFVNPSNLAPRKLLKKLGFIEKGVKRSMISSIFFKEPFWIRAEKTVE